MRFWILLLSLSLFSWEPASAAVESFNRMIETNLQSENQLHDQVLNSTPASALARAHAAKLRRLRQAETARKVLPQLSLAAK